VARLAAAILAVLAVASLPAQANARAWSKPVRLAAPVAGLSPLGPQAAEAPNGQAAVAFGLVRPDAPTAGQASLALLTPSGHPAKPLKLPTRHEVLDVGYIGGTLEILTGSSPARQPCCTSVELLALGPHGLTTPHRLLRGVSGFGTGRIVPAGRGTLVAYANPSGLWVTQAKTGERFGPAHRLSTSATLPVGLGAVGAQGHTLVAWLTGGDQSVNRTPPSTVMSASGSGAHIPTAPEVRLTLAAGHAGSEFTLLHGAARSMAAWVEDYFDTAGTYHSGVVAADLAASPHPRVFSQGGDSLAGLAGGSDATGDQVLVWKACDLQPVCSVVAVSRQAHARFGPPVTLGTIDPAADPAVAVGRGGQAVVGWVQHGHVMVTARAGATRRFASPKRLAGPGTATGLTLAAAPDGRVAAAWSESAATTSFLASVWR
jgi:hypothetical protein